MSSDEYKKQSGKQFSISAQASYSGLFSAGNLKDFSIRKCQISTITYSIQRLYKFERNPCVSAF